MNYKKPLSILWNILSGTCFVFGSFNFKHSWFHPGYAWAMIAALGWLLTLMLCFGYGKRLETGFLKLLCGNASTWLNHAILISLMSLVSFIKTDLYSLYPFSFIIALSILFIVQHLNSGSSGLRIIAFVYLVVSVTSLILETASSFLLVGITCFLMAAYQIFSKKRESVPV